MKKFTILTVLLLVALSVWSQTLDLTQLDISKVNTSNATVKIQGPVEFYISGLQYMGKSYAAIIEFDGVDSLTVNPVAVAEGLQYQMIDVSNLEIVKPDSLGGVVTLEDLVLENYEFEGELVLDTTELASGKIVFIPKAAFARTGMAAGHPTLLAAAADAAKTSNAKIAALMAENAELEADLAAAGTGEAVAVSTTTTTTTMAGGPSMAGAYNIYIDPATLQSYGTWKETSTGIDMTSASAKYAKIGAALIQNAKEIFYSVTIDANSNQKWVGAGFHILGSVPQSIARYGLGKSYLVWITKDASLQTDASFIQLYESTTDGRMYQIASEMIDGDINSTNNIVAYVNKTNNMITVSVNGEEMISYESNTALPSGIVAALRAAGGPVSFTKLSVKIK